jgi:DNA-binding response OmpR family regulator
MRILFVEDQRVFAETVVGQFLSAHQVEIAETIAGAHQALAAGGFDAVLVDYDLSDGKGTEVIRYLRTSRFRGMIVAVSAKDEGNALLRSAGAHAICKKAELHRIAATLAALAR